MLRRGAEALGWQNSEIPRWMKYADNDPAKGQRQSMTRTYLPRAVDAGARLVTGCRIDALEMSGGSARRATTTLADGRRGHIRFRHVFVCGGAIQSPALLQRSHIAGHIGRSLAVHPTVKLAARFADELNVTDDVPVHQVKEFAPDLSFGGSASQPGLIALALSDQWSTFSNAITDWRRISVYYAAITSEGRGKVRAVRGLRDPIVTYGLTRRDRALLGSGLARLALRDARGGGRRGVPVVPGCARRAQARVTWPRCRPAFSAARASVMTVHLCSTVPMGEDTAKCGAELVRSGARHGKRVGQRRLAAAHRARSQPTGHGDGTGDSQRPALRGHGVTLMVDRLAAPAVTVVTGASGWLGRALVHRLLADEARPRLRLLARTTAEANVLESLGDVEVVIGDIAKPDTMARLLHDTGSRCRRDSHCRNHPPDDHEAVLRDQHRGHPPRDGSSRSTTECVASCTSRRTARSARIHTTATPSGRTSRITRTTGTASRRCRASWRCFEAIDRGLDATIVRPPWFYGPFQPPRQTTFFRLIRAGRFPVVGDGEQRRSMVYVDNLVDGVIAAELTPAARARATG